MSKESLNKRFMAVSQKLVDTDDSSEESKLLEERSRLLKDLKSFDVSISAAYASMVK